MWLPSYVDGSHHLLFLAPVPALADAAMVPATSCDPVPPAASVGVVGRPGGAAALAASPPKHRRRTRGGSQPWHRRPHLGRAQTRRPGPSWRAEVCRCGRSSPLIVVPLPLLCHRCPCPSLSPSCFPLPPQWIRWIRLLSYLRVGGCPWLHSRICCCGSRFVLLATESVCNSSCASSLIIVHLPNSDRDEVGALMMARCNQCIVYFSLQLGALVKLLPCWRSAADQEHLHAEGHNLYLIYIPNT
jgi:hypothetical protein